MPKSAVQSGGDRGVQRAEHQKLARVRAKRWPIPHHPHADGQHERREHESRGDERHRTERVRRLRGVLEASALG
jgi:hypothetical protein